MASAQKHTVKREVVKTVLETVTVLELNQNEAETLCVILNAIGGDPTTSPRLYSAAILSALSAVGIRRNPRFCLEKNFSSLYFQDKGITDVS